METSCSPLLDTPSRPSSRRSFLAATAVLPSTLAAAHRVCAANERVGVAVIGVNGMGSAHVGILAARSDVDLVALCDLDPSVLARVSEKIPERKPKLVTDFREVLANKAVDAVVISTPHHWHMPIALRALAADKDVYVEKPASHVFHEGRLLVQAAARRNRVVQHGTQMRSSEVTVRAAEVLASGILGEIRMAKAWNCQRQENAAPVPDGVPPSGVDYDRWLGPARKRAFNPQRFHRTWRQFREYGNGDIGDDGAHDIDLARWGLGENTHPVRITAHGSSAALGSGYREYPDNMMVTYEYASGKVLLYEDRQWTPYGLHGVDSGNAFYGEKGYMIFSRRGFFQVFLGPKEEPGPAVGKAGRVGTPLGVHHANFLECVRSRKATNATAETAHYSCGLIHLGEIVYRTGRVLRFDPRTETFPDDREASALLTKDYRRPWTVEGIV